MGRNTDMLKYRELAMNISDMYRQQDKHCDNRNVIGYDFRQSLKAANRDYQELDVNSEGTFDHFIEKNYGIKLYLDKDGGLMAYYDIVDEQQYLIFKLKYA